MLEMDLQMDDPEGYLTKCADRSIFPDLQFCYRLVGAFFHILKWGLEIQYKEFLFWVSLYQDTYFKIETLNHR